MAMRFFNPVAVASALKQCCTGNIKTMKYVLQIHGMIFQYGLGSNPKVGNPLIDLYSKTGRVQSARAVFEGLSLRDNTSWVAMVTCYSQNDFGADALLLYRRMHRAGIVPTPFFLSSVLSACTKSGLFKNGEQVLSQVMKCGFYYNTFVCNALITLYSRIGIMNFAERIFTDMPHRDRVTYNALISGHMQHGVGEDCIEIFKKKKLHSYVLKSGASSDYIEGSLLELYVKSGDVENARKLFDTTDKENVVLWNVMLVAYGQLGKQSESFNLFYEMQVKGVKPNQYTYPSIIRTCIYVGAIDLCEQIHTLVFKTGFESNIYVGSVLIDMYSKFGMLSRAREILGRLNKDDVVSWTTMISGYERYEFFDEALRTFQEMRIIGIQPDNIGYASAIKACAGLKSHKQGLQIHSQASISGYSNDLSVGNSLINLYARSGRIMEAYSAFENVEHKDEATWNSLMSGFTESGHFEEALRVFMRMNRANVGANSFTFGSVVRAAADMADIKQGKQIHSRLVKTGHEYEMEVSNAIISLYAKCGCIEDAKLQFFKMSWKNEISWNAIITCFSRHGHGHDALKLFEQMKDDGFQPNHVTFLGVLAACSHVGLVQEGLYYFHSMSNLYGIIPRSEHYACVVDILGRAKQLHRAKEFIDEMPIIPDAMVWRTLLSACTVHKNAEIGEFAAHHLLRLEPLDSANYVLLSNAYAVTGKWDLRDRVRQMMKDRGVKKEPGRSWIEANNTVHQFFVGDRLHHQVDAIYEFFDDLNKRALQIGYKQDRNFLLSEAEQEQKDTTSLVHSEKLAVSFGLMSLSHIVPIRVFKNLRICNDCHNWMKAVSNVTRRTIIVRDAYRFHHFEKGSCSCGDFW